MASVTITVPTFDWAAFYYGEILEALISHKRVYAPELTDESQYETTIQILRAFACVGHLNNTLTDLVANESTLKTAKLAESVRNHLRLIDYEMSPATPAKTTLVCQLSASVSATTRVATAPSLVTTRRTPDSDLIYFEILSDIDMIRTDQHEYVFAEEDGVFTDFTTKANSPTTPADDWSPWASAAMKDAIYWGHSVAMWDTLSVPTIGLPGANFSGVWEVYDGDWKKVAPTSVTDQGSTLEVDLTSLLGYSNRQGTKVRVHLNSTGAYEELESTWTGSANIATTTGLLGQSSPSEEPDDYTIGSDWTIIEVTDETQNFTQAGDVTYELPQTEALAWIKNTINSVEAYWLRYRIITAPSPTEPIFNNTQMNQGKLYFATDATQGRTVVPDVYSSTGEADQRFDATKENFIWGSETVTVEGEEWKRVTDFLNSAPANKHYVVELGENDRATFVFGSGDAGEIPPVGVNNIEVSYRYGAKNDGNVGANTVTVDKTGLSQVTKVWNPRQASGWTEAEGASEESLERVKISGPATLRTKEVALGPDDVVDMTLAYTDDDGVSPFVRANAFEEGFGPKTIELVVVAAGGAPASAAQLTALDLYFNGDKFASPPVKQRIVANQEVRSVNYTAKTINVTATVYGTLTVAQIQNGLSRLLQPEARKDDGVSWEWEFGSSVPVSRLTHEIFDIDNTKVTKVVITTPSSDVLLQARELPTAGTFNITVLSPV